ncbi:MULTISPECIES: ABC transporter substrate-binding protein [Halorussus]|uniref:ABC transporter substrate-binding protein n=1 Tax=Halorussus TaxID=1070314 RepID=UPI00209F7911|nr:ABC transporter substrate-binding protein [Halorussus vallis]USZ75033.1 ABC transporter substrate-binding protein [Halorussus vallis]
MPERTTVRLFHLPFSFMLPQRVASDRGYFGDEGLEVELVERDREEVERKYIPAEETLTDDYDVDLYPICKWESLKRTWDMRDGKVVAKGTFADQPYAVFTRPDTGIETPEDLAGVPVAVNRRTGQEYTAIRALEAHVAAEEVTLEHHGMPTDRLRALRDREVDAATLLEPHSTLAEELGFERVTEFENHMGIVGGERLTGETLRKFMRGYRRAVEAVNENPENYRELYLDMLEKDESVAPTLFEEVDVDAVREKITVPEYETPELADYDELREHLDWMKARDLVDEEAEIRSIVAPGGRP